MQNRTSENKNGVLITVEMACNITNLGRTTVRRIAQESKAARKIGRCLRINRQIFLDYLDSLGN